MAALSPNPYSPATLWSDAYNMRLNLESVPVPDTTTLLSVVNLFAHAFFGYVINNAPTDHGHTNFSNEIHDCIDDREFFPLADKYKSAYVRCC